MTILNNKGHKKLNVRELAVLNHFRNGESELEAFKLGYPYTNRFEAATVAKMALEFFKKPRMIFYLKRNLPTEKDIKVISPGGQPCLYRPRYIQKCIDYYNKPAREIVQKTSEDGEISTELIVNALPTRSGFACYIGVPKTTINGWLRMVDENGDLKYPEFVQAYEMGRDYTENILIENTLRGEYNPGFAKFVAQNLLDWSDKREITTTDESKPQVQINVNMTAEEAARIYLEMQNPAIDKK